MRAFIHTSFAIIFLLANLTGAGCKSRSPAPSSSKSEDGDKDKILASFVADGATVKNRPQICEALLQYQLTAADLQQVANVVRATNEHHGCLVDLLQKAKKASVNVEGLADDLWQIVLNLSPEPWHDSGRYVYRINVLFEIAVGSGARQSLQQAQLEHAAFLLRSKNERQEIAGMNMMAILAGAGSVKARAVVIDAVKAEKRISYEAIIEHPSGFKGLPELIDIAKAMPAEQLVKYARFGDRSSMADVLIRTHDCSQDIVAKAVAFIAEENRKAMTLTQDRYPENSALFRYLAICSALKNQILPVYAQTIRLLGKEPVDRYFALTDFLDSLRTLSKATNNKDIRDSLKSIRPWTTYTESAKKTAELVDELLANLNS